VKNLENTQNNNMFFCKKLSNPISPCPLSGFQWNKDHISCGNVYLMALPWVKAGSMKNGGKLSKTRKMSTSSFKKKQ
jgi:hypothetical protein